MGGQRHALAALPLGKTRYPLYRTLVGWFPWPVWTGAEISPSRGFDPRTAHSLASRYTDWATSAHIKFKAAYRFCPSAVVKTQKYKCNILETEFVSVRKYNREAVPNDVDPLHWVVFRDWELFNRNKSLVASRLCKWGRKNCVLLLYVWNTRQWTKSKPMAVTNVIHHSQNYEEWNGNLCRLQYAISRC